MAQNNSISLPAGFGGLTRFKEEYESKIKLRPSHIIILVILIVLVRIGLGLVYK